MDIFLMIIKYLVMFAVGLTALRMYLTVNKLWKRKRDKSVTESISIFASFLAIFIHFPFMFKFALIDKQVFPAMNEGLNGFAYIIIILIGTGLWVKENKFHSFIHLILKAIRLESKESADLFKAFVNPGGAKQILNILQKVTTLDKKISDEELQLIKDFAAQWKIDIPDNVDFNAEWETNLLDIRQSVTDYLDISSPTEQAAELIDLIELVIKADKIVTTEESLFYEEVKSMIGDYVSHSSDGVMYYVYIVPQHNKQFEAIKTLFPNSAPEDRRGGQVFVRGKFYSKGYAEAICQKYSALGMFTIWDEHRAA